MDRGDEIAAASPPLAAIATRREMARRFAGQMFGERYLADTTPARRVVHDLDMENRAPYACQIDSIIAARAAQPFETITTARAAGFVDCPWCIGRPGEHRIERVR